MNIRLKLFLSIIVLAQLYLILNRFNKKKLTIKYTIYWIMLLLIMEIFVIFPNVLILLSEFLGFEATSNMILFSLFFFLFYICFLLTAKLSVQKMQIKNLIQEISILKKENKCNERKN